MTDSYDIVIVGGGIHGVGVAQAAAAAGYSVMLLEQNTIASGTSSRSSKLIHGGLRYLESYQFSLVREWIKERNLLLKLAPDLVQLKPFYIPVYKSSTRSAFKIRVGLNVYAILGNLNQTARFSDIPKNEWGQLDGLNTDGLQKVFSYFDAQTDDTALTRSVMASAQSMGTVLNESARLNRALKNEQGVELEYEQQGRTYTCTARVLVNAAGPWVNHVAGLVAPEMKILHVDLVQGTHIIVDGSIERGVYYLESPSDHRAIFVIPWKGKVMVGTTETHYDGNPADVRPLPKECDYLAGALRYYFPQFESVSPDKVDAFAGLRVLPKSHDDPFHRHRDTVLLVDNEQGPSVLSIYGGKLTAYRATAESVMKRLQTSLPGRKKIADTDTLSLYPVD